MGKSQIYRLFSLLTLIDHIRILGIELELARNRGSCGGISLKIFACVKIAPNEPRLQASSSLIPRIRNRPIAPLTHVEIHNSQFTLKSSTHHRIHETKTAQNGAVYWEGF